MEQPEHKVNAAIRPATTDIGYAGTVNYEISYGGVTLTFKYELGEPTEQGNVGNIIANGYAKIGDALDEIKKSVNGKITTSRRRG
jgi:hypothetical protein